MADYKEAIIRELMAQGNDEHYSWIRKIPEPLKEGLVLYRNEGVETGGFLRAVLENDFREAIARADNRSYSCLREILWWLQRFMPSGAWGDMIKVSLWIHDGGLIKKDDEYVRSFLSRRAANLRELGINDEITGL